MSKPILTESIPADEENFPGGFMDDKDVSFVHLSKKEALIWDTVQGGPYIEQEEGYLPLRSYRPLGRLIKDPNFMELVFEVKKQSGKDGIPDNPEMKQAYEQGMELAEKPSKKWQPAPGDDIPDIVKMAKDGQGGDTIVVYMPGNVIYMMGQLGDGTVHINPKTGFPEFFVKSLGKAIGKMFSSNPVREVVRIGATVAGAVMGGPLGAMAGSVAGSALTGRQPGDWLNPALQAGALAYGTQALAPHIPGFGALGGALAGSGIPGMGALGQTMSGWANPAVAGAAGTAAATGAAQAGQPGSNMVNYVGLKGVNGPAGVASQGAPAGLASFMSNPMMQALPHAMNIGAGFMAKNAEKERYRLEQQEREQYFREQRQREEEALQKAGFYEPLKHREHEDVVVNPLAGAEGEPYLIYKGDDRYERIKKGGKYSRGGEIYSRETIPLKKKTLIDGPGKGQTDAIHTNAAEGSYIVPADVVGMMGDGSTDAGIEIINDFFADVESKFSPDRRSSYNNRNAPQHIPVALSRGEAYIPPHWVVALGRGHHSQGVKMLNALRENVRKHKISNGTNLPPKAKHIRSYMEA